MALESSLRKKNGILLLVLILSLIIFTILVSGCTSLNSVQEDFSSQKSSDSLTNTPVETPIEQSPIQAEIVKPFVSWKDFYPDHDEQTKKRIIEEAKDEIMRVFPDVDRSTLNGVWVEHLRISGPIDEKVGRPYIEFENLEFSTGDSRLFAIKVDPEQMKVISFYPYKGVYNQPIISYEEGKKRTIDFIKKVQGEDSIANDPDAHVFYSNDIGNSGRPIASVSYNAVHNGVQYQYASVLAEYDMSRDKIERYYDDLANPELFSGLTTLSPEPEITLDEAVQMFKDKVSVKYNLDKLDFECKEVFVRIDDYLMWWDNNNLVYADDPEPIPLVWYIGFTDNESREEYEKSGIYPVCGEIRVDAHTGEVYRLMYKDIAIKTFGYMA